MIELSITNLSLINFCLSEIFNASFFLLLKNLLHLWMCVVNFVVKNWYSMLVVVLKISRIQKLEYLIIERNI